MKLEFLQTNDPYDYSECLEFIAYEALARRNAVLCKMRASIGPNLELEFGVDPASAYDLVDLHKALFQETLRCVEILRNLEATEYKMRGIRRLPSSGKSYAP